MYLCVGEHVCGYVSVCVCVWVYVYVYMVIYIYFTLLGYVILFWGGYRSTTNFNISRHQRFPFFLFVCLFKYRVY